MARLRGVVDVAVIGGGVVGLAVARAAALRGLRVAVFEKDADLCASPASGGNTGIACVPQGAPAGSLERSLLERAQALNAAAYAAQNVPHATTGALYVARDRAEVGPLRDFAEAHGADWLDAAGARAAAGADIGDDVTAAAYVAGEVVVDPWLVPTAWALAAEAHGAEILSATAVRGATRQRFHCGSDDGRWRLFDDGNAPICDAAAVVNCGGLWADAVEALVAEPDFAVAPCRGDYVVFGSVAGAPAIPIGGVPGAAGRGPYAWTTVHGDVVVGPTAEDVARVDVSSPPSAPAERALRRAADRIPALRGAPVVARYAGLRPGLAGGAAYRVYEARPRWIAVAGVRSTGLTASLAIADHVCGLLRLPPAPPAPTLPRLPDLAALRASFADGSVDLGPRTAAVAHPQTRFGLRRRLQRRP